ncbi:MAG: SagB/ThcOx family dehydrogenase [Peptoniphilaceae bacterium]
MNYQKDRDFLTDHVRQQTDFSRTDQSLGLPMPPVQKAPKEGQKPISLPDWHGVEKDLPLSALIAARKSVRKYRNTALLLEELSYLLWATQGVRQTTGAGTVLRNAPSAGNRQSLETYLAVFRVQGLEPGVYRYLPIEHALVFEHTVENMESALNHACLEQPFAGQAAVTFLWTTLPYRTEWRYADASYKVIAVDAGHVCQNLYLAATAIDCGTCAIGAYNQTAANAFLQVDPDEEFVVYIAPVGKKIHE